MICQVEFLAKMANNVIMGKIGRPFKHNHDLIKEKYFNLVSDHAKKHSLLNQKKASEILSIKLSVLKYILSR